MHANANEQEDDDVEVIAPPGETPIPRRSLRRLSIDQNTGSMTPRRSVRRASMDANIKIEQCTKPSRRASYSAVVESKTNAATLATPKRKRRLTEELSTPTRKSLRLCNTPKKPMHVDDAVGDMGVILEEDGGRAEGKLIVYLKIKYNYVCFSKQLIENLQCWMKITALNYRQKILMNTTKLTTTVCESC